METKMTFTDDVLLDDGQNMRHVRLYDDSIQEFDPMIAYLKGDYYYVFRGSLQEKGATPDKPGIYMDSVTGTPILFNPSTDAEKKEYTYADKISSSTASDIIDKINRHEVQVFVLPEASRAYCPTITEADDILKRVMKQAIIDKGIDLERFKHRFIDKNALFNFKQVLKGDNRLSMLLFDRGTEAFNLRYTIIVEEAKDGEVIGMPLEKPIVISSDDTFDVSNASLIRESKSDEEPA